MGFWRPRNHACDPIALRLDRFDRRDAHRRLGERNGRSSEESGKRIRVQVVIEQGEGISLAVHELFVVDASLVGRRVECPVLPETSPRSRSTTVTAFHPGRRSEGQLGALARPAPKAERTVGCGWSVRAAGATPWRGDWAEPWGRRKAVRPHDRNHPLG